MTNTKILEETVNQLNAQYYRSLQRIVELNEQVFGLKQVRDVATDLVKELTVTNLNTVIQANHMIIEHMETLKSLLEKP